MLVAYFPVDKDCSLCPVVSVVAASAVDYVAISLTAIQANSQSAKVGLPIGTLIPVVSGVKLPLMLPLLLPVTLAVGPPPSQFLLASGLCCPLAL